MSDDRLLYSVDRSWSNYRGNSDGELAASDFTKLHLDRGDTTAKCSGRVPLNSLKGDRPAGTVDEVESATPQWVCRRCVPRRPADVEIRRQS